MLSWLADNKEWVFGGAGVALISGLVAVLKRRNDSVSQRQTSGDNSTNIQVGRNLNTDARRPDSDDGR